MSPVAVGKPVRQAAALGIFSFYFADLLLYQCHIILVRHRLALEGVEEAAKSLLRKARFREVSQADKVRMQRRGEFLRGKYGLLNYSETGGARCETTERDHDHVREIERELWKSAMASKTTRRLYCDKEAITTEPFYDNSSGSALLFEARVGAFRTLDYRSRFGCVPEVQAAVCRGCGGERETAEHLIGHCAKLSPTTKEGTTMPQPLGFLDAESGRCFEGVATTKARLEQWWRAIKQSRTVPGVV
ncbi:hypothetical protein HPB49_007379 [Dermacentor silvarum]|uniref:Uncharacterized protein n=1 Tax=Dermacentor silvarum TaxID=543639 RepID=A0ACB8CJU0_DERSI|nr:hypothetical protein HPB49_007379 [Dermacentor silvarum]